MVLEGLSKKWSVLGKIRVFWVFKVENRIFSMQNKVETTILGTGGFFAVSRSLENHRDGWIGRSPSSHRDDARGSEKHWRKELVTGFWQGFVT
jgi:hypothetical protein